MSPDNGPWIGEAATIDLEALDLVRDIGAGNPIWLVNWGSEDIVGLYPSNDTRNRHDRRAAWSKQRRSA